MFNRISLIFAVILSYASVSFALNTELIQRGLDDLGSAQAQLEHLIEVQNRINNDSNAGQSVGALASQLKAIESLIAQSHQNIASGLKTDQQEKPQNKDYKWACQSRNAPGAMGKGWTRLEAISKAAPLCKNEKDPIFCQDVEDYGCEELPDSSPLVPLDYSKVCISRRDPTVIGYGWTVVEAIGMAASKCAKEQPSYFCSDKSDFGCEDVDPSIIRKNP